jgi:hypothetical protein
MSKRLDVVKAVKELLKAAFPGFDVKGLDADAAFPDRIPPNGLIIVRNSDPGAPEVDLCPPTYNYEHPIKVEIAGYSSPTKTPAEVVDEILETIGTAVQANRMLAGLCSWLDTEAPAIDDFSTEGSRSVAMTELNIIAHYSTPNPLT